MPREAAEAREEAAEEGRDGSRVPSLRHRLDVRLRRGEERDAGEERDQETSPSFAADVGHGAEPERAFERPAGEREEERHVELVDEPDEQVEGVRLPGALDVPSLVVEWTGGVEHEQQEGRPDPQPVDVVPASADLGDHRRVLYPGGGDRRQRVDRPM